MLKNLALAAVSILILGGLFVALRPAPTASEPEEREIEVEVDEEGMMDPDEISVGEGDTVSLLFSTERPNPVHLHGYDIHGDVEDGEAEMSFEADLTGRFEIMEHPADYGEEGAHEEDCGHSHEEDASHGEDTMIGALIVEPR